jgi:hypothetical protein
MDDVSGLEIVAGSSYGGLMSWESDCDSRLGSPVILFGHVDATAQIADIDKNDGGKLEMLAKDLSGRVYLYDLNSTGPIEWGQFAHDARHTSRYGAPLTRDPYEDRPESVTLWQNAPNPFNPSTVIGYEIGYPSRVTLMIYDIAGRLVRRLVDTTQEPGRYRVIWEGKDDRGRAIGSGVYFYRLEAGSLLMTQKMVLLK